MSKKNRKRPGIQGAKEAAQPQPPPMEQHRKPTDRESIPPKGPVQL